MSEGNDGVEKTYGFNLFNHGVLPNLGVNKQIIVAFTFKGWEGTSFKALSPLTIVSKCAPQDETIIRRGRFGHNVISTTIWCLERLFFYTHGQSQDAHFNSWLLIVYLYYGVITIKPLLNLWLLALGGGCVNVHYKKSWFFLLNHCDNNIT